MFSEGIPRPLLQIYMNICVKKISRFMTFGWPEWQVFGCGGHPELLEGKLKIFPPAIFEQINLCWAGRARVTVRCTLRAHFYFVSRAVCRWCRWLDNKQQRSTLAHLWLAPHRESQLNTYTMYSIHTWVTAAPYKVAISSFLKAGNKWPHIRLLLLHWYYIFVLRISHDIKSFD